MKKLQEVTFGELEIEKIMNKCDGTSIKGTDLSCCVMAVKL